MRLIAIVSFAILVSMPIAQSAEPGVVQAPPFRVIGFGARTSNARESTPDGLIGGLWQKVSAPGAFASIPKRVDSNLYAVYTNYESDADGAYTVVIGVRVPDNGRPLAGMEAISVVGGAYAIFESDIGPARSIGVSTWRRIWSWPARNSRAYKTDYELHHPITDPTKTRISIYIGVR